jgi:hypothetical protein
LAQLRLLTGDRDGLGYDHNFSLDPALLPHALLQRT